MVNGEKSGDKSGETSLKLSPYTILSNDTTGSIITHVVLRGPNYEEWSRGIRTSLLAKFKLGFIDGTITQPEDGSNDLDRWWIINAMVVTWIFSTIDPDLRSTITYRLTAKELWDDIQQRFSVGNASRVYQLKSDIIECKQKSAETIMAYFGRKKKIWDDLNHYEPVQTCSCTGCKCNITTKLQTQREEERVRQFLMGLHPSYAAVRSQILGTEPLINLNQAYSKLVQEEGVRAITRISTEPSPEIMTFNTLVPTDVRASRTGGPSTTEGDRRLCTACKQEGHLASSCFRVTGNFPPWWGNRPRYRIDIHGNTL